MPTSKQLLYSEHWVKRKLPANFNAVDEPFFANDYEHFIPAAYSLRLKGAHVTSEGIVFRGLKPVPESLRLPPRHYGLRYRLSCLLKRRRVRLPDQEEYLMPFDVWSSGYFHWMLDCLPRIHILRERARNSVLLLPEAYAGFHLKSLALYEFKSIFQIPANSYVHVPNLLMPTRIAPTGNYNETVIKNIRETYRQHYRSTSIVNHGERVYISREKATRRKIVNEPEVVSLLKDHGFTIVNFEDWSFDQQVAIAAQIKVLVSIHGAGLTNMLFMNENASVMELRRSGDTTNLCYFSLASALGLRYYYQFGSPENIQRSTFDDNLKIDLTQLKSNLKKC